MRNPERLDGFYKQMSTMHKNYCPDLRFGQFVEFIFAFIRAYGIDPFYLEEEDILQFAYKAFTEDSYQKTS